MDRGHAVDTPWNGHVGTWNDFLGTWKGHILARGQGVPKFDGETPSSFPSIGEKVFLVQSLVVSQMVVP